MRYKSYKHITLKEAKNLMRSEKSQKLLIHTINWTFATEKGKQVFDKVHKNIYETTLPKLCKWIAAVYDKDGGVAEDIYRIELIK